MRLQNWLNSFGRKLRTQRSKRRTDWKTQLRQDRMETLESRVLLVGNISGQVFADANGNGALDGGTESGLAGVEVFLDINDDGVRQLSEPLTVTGGDGSYSFNNVSDDTYSVRTIETATSRQSGPTTFVDGVDVLNVPGRTEHVYDPTRGLLYIGTNTGSVERYDLRQQRFLDPLDVAVDVASLDVTPDGQFLYIAERQDGATEAFLRQVDLNTGAVNNISFNTQGLPDGVFDVDIVSDGRVLFTGSFSGSGNSAIRQFDPQTGLITVLANVREDTRMKTNFDRTKVVFGEGNISSGPLRVLDVATNTITGVNTNGFMDLANFHINNDGSVVAVEIFQDTLELRDPANNFNVIASTSVNFDAGTFFDPFRNVLYAGDSQNDQLVAFEVPTLNELFRIDVGVDLGRSYRQISTTPDGRFAFMSGAADSVLMFEVAQPSSETAVVQGNNVTGVDFGHTVVPNNLPVARDDFYDIGAGNSVGVSVANGVLANDFDGELNQTLTVALIDDVQDGIVTLQTDGSFSYQRGVNFDGTDFFTYQISDGVGQSNIGTVTISGVPKPDTTLSGTVFEDENSNGVQDGMEAGLDGQTVFIDANNNDQLDVGEQSVMTSNGGGYTFASVPSGDVKVVLMPETGFVQTAPVSDLSADGFTGVTNAVDFIFDGNRGVQYITTSDGFIQRYDLRSETLLEPWRVGVNLGGIDITPDGAFLYVAEQQAGATESYVRKVDTATGEVTDLRFARNGLHGGTFDVVIMSNDKAFVTSRFAGSGNVPLREIDLTNDTFTERETIRQDSRLSRSASRDHFFMTQSNTSNGPIALYSVDSDSFDSSATTDVFLGDSHAAVNSDGTLIALEDNQHIGLSVVDATLANVVEILPNIRGGVAFHPSLPILFAGDNATDEIVAFDTNSFEELYRLPIGGDIGTGRREMQVTSDGKHLFLQGENGVFVYQLGTPEARIVPVAGQPVTGINFGAREFTENQAPQGVDDFYVIGGLPQITVTTVNGVLTNDRDINVGQTLTATILDDPQFGTVSLSPNGAFQYVKGPSFTGVDSFTYTLSDGITTDAPVEVTISQATLNESSISGLKFLDIDGDGSFDPMDGEVGLPGIIIYADLNGNSNREGNEPFAVSGNDGTYTIENLFPGTYTVREESDPNSTATTPSTATTSIGSFVDIAQAEDLVYDPTREIVFITRSDGRIDRYDVNADTLLATWNIGTDLGGIDITADGAFLYVAERMETADVSTVYKIDATSGAVTSINVPTAGSHSGFFDVAVNANGEVFATGRFAGSGNVDLTIIDIATDTFSTGLNLRQDTRMDRSGDYSTLFLREGNISSGPITIYNSGTDTFSPMDTVFTFISDSHAALNEDGTKIAFEDNGFIGLSLMDNNLETDAILPRIRGGVAFHPELNLLFAGDSAEDELVVIDLDTQDQVARLSFPEDLSSGYAPAAASATHVFSILPSHGLQVFDVAVETGTFEGIEVGIREAVSGFDFGNIPNSPTLFAISTDTEIIESDGPMATSITVVRGGGDPNDTVVLTLASSDPTAAVPPATVTLNPGEISTTIDIAAIDDDFVDGPQTAAISIDAAGFIGDVVVIDVLDDEVAGFAITESNGDTIVNEPSDSDTVSVVLTARPLTDVVFNVGLSDGTRVQSDTSQLTFTSDNWNVPQDVTLTAIDNNLIDGTGMVSLTVAVVAAQSNDRFDNLDLQAITVDIIDDDVAGLLVVESDGSTDVNEFGVTDDFTVQLTAEPFVPVVIDIVSLAPTQVTTDVLQLSFDNTNWNVPQTVVASAIADMLAEGPQSYSLALRINDLASDDNFDLLPDELVTVNVADLPVFDSIPDLQVDEDSGLGTFGMTGISSGGTGQAVRFFVSSDDPSLISSIGVNHPTPLSDTATLEFTPEPNAFGEVTITVEIESPGPDDDFNQTDDNLKASQDFVITINPVNDAPVATSPMTVSVDEDSEFLFAPMVAPITILDVDAPDLKVTVSVDNGGLFLPPNTIGLILLDGTQSGDNTLVMAGLQGVVSGALRGLTYRPDSDFSGTDTLTLTVDDEGRIGAGGAMQNTVQTTINVNPIDDIPVNTVPGPQSIDEDGTLVFSAANQNAISITDIDTTMALDVTLTAVGGTFSLGDISGLANVIGSSTNTTTVALQGSEVELNEALEGLTFSPTPDAVGAASLELVTNDPFNGMAATDTDTINITIEAVNDAPVNTVPGPVSTLEDTQLVFSSGNGNQIAISDAIDGDQGEMQVELNVTSGLLTLSGTAGLTFLQGGQTDDFMRFTGTVANINGALEGLSFNPASQFDGVVNLRLATSDQGNTGAGLALTDVDEFTITVDAVDDPPVGGPETYQLRAGTTVLAEDTDGSAPGPNDNSVLLNDFDPDSAILTATLENGPSSATSFMLNGDGTFTYEHNNDAAISDSFTYRVNDGTSPSDPITVSLLINQPPSVTGGTFSVAESASQGALIGQVSFTDPNPNDTALFSIIDGDIDGVFTINPVSGFITVADPTLLNFEANSVYNLTIQAEDSAPTSVRAAGTATVTINVTDVVEPLTIGVDDWEADGLSLLRDGDSLRVVRTGTTLDVIPPQAIATTSNISVRGRDGLNDLLTVDFSGGNPIIQPFLYEGGNAAFDALALANGMFDSVGHRFIDNNSGFVDVFDGSTTSTIEYSGLEPIFDSLTATTRTFDFGSGDDVVELAGSNAVNDRTSILSSTTSETVEFTNPTDSITINLADGADSFTVISTEAELAADVIVNGGVGNDTIDAGGLTVPGTLNGDEGTDNITGGPANDRIDGGNGDDLLNGAGGDDLVIGSFGNDVINGNEGNDVLLGGAGSDTADGGAGNDVVRTHGGSRDFLTGGLGDDLLDGGAGQDRIVESIEGDFVLTTNSMTGVGNDAIAQVEGIGISANDEANTIDISGFLPVGLTGATLLANGGDDQIFGSEGTDFLFGGSGNDVIHGNGGTDFLRGAAGADELHGGEGDDNLRGQGGDNDRLFGGGGADFLDGGAGIDFLFESGGSFAFFGDFLSSASGVDRVASVERINLTGDDSDNLINVADYDEPGGIVEINGAGGNDRIIGSRGVDIVFGGAGNDTIQTLAGDDVVIGEDGDDVILAGDGNDFVHGTNGDDTVYGGDGDDTINGGAGNDGISGGQDNDLLLGSSGEDTAVGNEGNDTLEGGTFRDSLIGGLGADVVEGQGHSQDELAGGSGAGADPGDQIIGSANEVDEFFSLSTLAPWFDDNLNSSNALI